MRNHRQTILIALIILMAVGMLLISTDKHIGACPDSSIYVGVAKNLLSGAGMTMPVVNAPLTHYPPFYPILLSISGLFGMDMLVWALVLNIFILLLNVLLAKTIASRLGLENVVLPVALIALCPGILTVHWMIWSEPVFILLGFAGLVAVDIYLKSNRIGYLWLAGLLIGFAWLDRYAGVAFIVGVCGVLWLFSSKRFKDIFLFASLSVVPMLTWLAYSAIVNGNPTNRSLFFRSITASEAITLIAEIFLAWVIYEIVRRKGGGTLHHLLALTTFAYLAVLAVTVCLLDAATPVFDTRIQAPVLFAILLLLPWFTSLYRPRTARLFSAVLVSLVIIQLAGSLFYASVGYVKGLEFTNGRWSQENLTVPAHTWY